MNEFQTLHERVSKSGPSVAEVLCRKYLAKTPNDLRAWKLLLDILIHTKNYKEVLLLVAALVNSNFCNQSCLILCVRYLLLSNNYSAARQLFSKIDFEKADQSLRFKDDLYHLAILKKLESNESTPALEFEIINSAANEFNKKILELNKTKSIQVICYLQNDFHYVIQAQIASELFKNGINVLFSNSLWFVRAIKPKVLLVSEALYQNFSEIRNSSPETLIVNTRHGLGDKNHAAIGASQADRICVSSENIAKLMINEMLTPKHKIWVTGYPQMDELFENIKTDPKKGNDTFSKTVIFAPTFSRDLSSAYLLKDDLVKSIRGDNKNIKIIVKPHPHLLRDAPEIINNWVQESKKHSNVFIDTDPVSNIMDYFHQCDLMISDVSSAALAWFSVNKPLICLIDRIIAQTSENFSDDGLEWKMHEAATVVSSASELTRAVNNLLINPDDRVKNRMKFSDFLFGNLTDGRGSYRVAVNIIEYLMRSNND